MWVRGLSYFLLWLIYNGVHSKDPSTSSQLMNEPINEQLAVYFPSKLYYSGTHTTLSIQVMKHLIKPLASQRPRDNAVSSYRANTGI